MTTEVDTHGLTPVVLGSQRPALPQSDAFAPALTHGVPGGLESLIRKYITYHQHQSNKMQLELPF